MFYYKAKEGTKGFNLIHGLFNYHKKWTENKQEIEEFLGFPIEKNLYFDVNCLVIDKSALEKFRPEWKEQFKKNSYPATAKVNSKVNKEWKELAKKLGLRVVRISDVSFGIGTFGTKGSYNNVNGNFYYASERELNNLKDFDKVSESEFLKDRLAQAEKDESGQGVE